MNILFSAHSGLRYLVLLAALAAILALAYGVSTGRSLSLARTLATSFAGLLDFQIVIGILLVMGGVFPDAVTGHLMLMVLAAIVTHGAFIIGQQSSSDRRELAVRLGGIVLALALIVGGIMAVGQSVLGHSALHIGGQMSEPSAFIYMDRAGEARLLGRLFVTSRIAAAKPRPSCTTRPGPARRIVSRLSLHCRSPLRHTTPFRAGPGALRSPRRLRARSMGTNSAQARRTTPGDGGGTTTTGTARNRFPAWSH